MPFSTPPTETMTYSDAALGRLARWRQRVGLRRFGMGGLTALVLLGGVGVTGLNPTALQTLEKQVQSQFWQWRGVTPPPEDVVVLAVDEPTLNQVSQWPMPRAKYGEVIDRIMKAGARAVAVDVIWDFPSSFGSSVGNQGATEDCEKVQLSADDRALVQVLKKYGDRIVLATRFEESKGEGWKSFRLALPYCPYREVKAQFGNVNFLLESDQRVHRLGGEYLKSLVKQSPETYGDLIRDAQVSSFAEASLNAAKWQQSQKQPQNVFFYGPEETFRTYSFADVLTTQNWQTTLEGGQVFQGKLVLIGLTAPNPGDFVETAIGRMPGVEFHANAIATLLEGRRVRPMTGAWAVGWVGLVGLAGSMAVVRLGRGNPWTYLGLGLLASGIWGLVSYGSFVALGWMVPTMVPMAVMAGVGTIYMVGHLRQANQSQRQLQEKLLSQARVPEIQALINSESGLQEKLQARQLELLGTHIGGRYRIIKLLGSGGFGETYVAEDLQRPGHPECVVKQLSPTSNSPKHLKLASKLFKREAETLEILGEHEQIPRLLAYFEEQSEFYLVQELVMGSPLSEEVSLGRQLPEVQVTAILRELLQILSFVHRQGVIHRDIKPSNIIRRASDGRLVLIDFGAVKAVQNIGEEDLISDMTIGIGTQGYMAPEQQLGQPKFCSDLYALGMLGVQALTGVSPSHLKVDIVTEEIDWTKQTHASQGLIAIVQRLIARQHQNRYQTAEDVLQDLRQLSPFASLPAFLDEVMQEPILGEEDFQETKPWPNNFDSGDTEAELPPTEPPRF